MYKAPGTLCTLSVCDAMGAPHYIYCVSVYRLHTVLALHILDIDGRPARLLALCSISNHATTAPDRTSTTDDITEVLCDIVLSRLDRSCLKYLLVVKRS